MDRDRRKLLDPICLESAALGSSFSFPGGRAGCRDRLCLREHASTNRSTNRGVSRWRMLSSQETGKDPPRDSEAMHGLASSVVAGDSHLAKVKRAALSHIPGDEGW